MAPQELAGEQLSSSARRARIWEVRRFCQVLPSVVEYERGNETAHAIYPSSKPNGALAALLRGLIYQLDVDLAMVSLLDDHTQYFVSGASRHNVRDVKISMESTQWYGCESVIHHGGLCERTITLQNCPGNMAFYEELDMAHNERTRNLPFVKGDVATFRHYAGVPLNPYGGPNIGTVFIFGEKPSVATLSAGIRSYLTEAADHITTHLEQAVEALEGKRALRFNRGVASLLNMSSGNLNSRSFQTSFLDSECERPHSTPNLYRDGSSSYLYHLAATLLCDVFELGGVKIQRVGVSRSNVDADERRDNNSEVIAQHFESKSQDPGDPPEALLRRLLELFPQGVVFHIAAESSEITTATIGQSTAIQDNDDLFVELSNTFPNVEQMIMMPLWEAHYERNIGVVLGFVNRRSGVHLSTNDLSSLSAFCTTMMTQVQRFEVHAMDQIKSDFLGSISHEMRTPLHGILSSLELLADTPCDESQRDLLQIAQYSGSSLLDTIDRVLYFSGVSSETQLSSERPVKQLSERLEQKSRFLSQQTAAPYPKDELSGVIHVCESYLRHAVERLHLKRSVRPELFNTSKSAGTIHSSPALVLEEPLSVAPYPVIFFDTNATWSYCLTDTVNFKTLYTNLLDNALKFGDPTGCVCVYLNINQNLTRLSFSDTGKGVAPDFIRHVILDPFSQEDPLSEGTGLGLANAKHAVAQLGGRMAIDSDESRGSTFAVTFPSDQIAFHPPQKTADPETVEPQPAVLELPQLEMSLFMPRRWEVGNDQRGRRCAQLALDSLMRGVSRWFQTKSTIWRPPSPLPRLLFILLEDLHHALQVLGDEVYHINIVVLCPDMEKIPSLQKIPLQNATIIVGPVTTSSLEDALTRLFPGILLPSKSHPSFDQVAKTQGDGRKLTKVEDIMTLSTGVQDNHLLPGMLSDLKLVREDPDDISSGPAQQSISPNPTVLQSPHEVLSAAPKTLQTGIRTSSNQAQPSASILEKNSESNATKLKEPKLLLVDDNSINLKVLVMFARKCSTIPSKSAGSGQEAIDAINEALASESDELPKYDLVFLDLSMPEISGFDVARKIRELEACLEPISRMYICALTGLVSLSDRKKAFEAGVDDYISKPAKLEDIKAVISNWRNSLAGQQQYG
ncbi:unnamed protein product [Periconia digitata]|uniref:Uncharacterized protein n=1 Tax=Periconia digitata TaxID=1303443 RepID=A0A9W4UT52_9PLEO|nr:unnamed protein product [Periconia digitata]